MTDQYGVRIEEYCQRHYIKDFQMKYTSRQWEVTEEAVKGLVRYPMKTLETKRFNLVAGDEDRKICKGEFKVAKTDTSAKASGNRFIALVDTERKFSHVLLVYNKQDHVKGNHETEWWKSEIRSTYPELEDLL